MIRQRDSQHTAAYKANARLKFDESTYHFSSEAREKDFVDSQFTTPEQKAEYQAYRKEWHRRAAEFDAGEYPLAVTIELVSACNLKCTMCYTITPEFQDSVVGVQRVLAWDSVVRIVDECAAIGVHSILFSWRGESGMYRSKGSDGVVHDFADVLAYAREKGILEVTSLTNGRGMSDALLEKIVRAQPSWISFSVDGLPEEYAKIRQSIREEKTDPWGTVARTIRKMVSLRDELGLKRPQLRCNTIYPPIASDPERYRDLMEELGIGLVTVNEILDFRGAEIPEEDILDGWFCQYPFQRLTVSANGTILPCTGAHNEEEELVLGRYVGSPVKRTVSCGEEEVKEYPETSLLDAWHSEEIKNVQDLHREGRRKEIWACKHCRHGAQKHGVRWIPDGWDMQDQRWEDDRSWRNG